MGASIFPSALRLRAYELRIKKQRSLPTVARALREEFPEYRERLTNKIVSGIIRRMKKHSGQITRSSAGDEDIPDRFTEALFSGEEKDPEVVKIPKKNKTENVDIIAEARTLRDSGLRWGAIIEHLQKKHPGVHVPQAGRLSFLVRGGQEKVNKVFKITIEGSSGIMLRVDMPHKKITKILKTLLDLED